MHIACPADVGHENQQKPGVSIHLEPHATFLRARDSSVIDRDNTATLLRERDKHGMCKVEMLLGSVAPSAVGVLRAVVSGCQNDGWISGKAVLGARGITGEFIACAAREATVE